MLDRADGGQAKLLTRIGFDWSQRYWRTIEALRSLKLAYLDGELCALNADGVAVFSRLQAAMDEGRTDQLFFLALSSVPDWKSTVHPQLIERKENLKRLFGKEIGGLRFSEHVAGDGGLPRSGETHCACPCPNDVTCPAAICWTSPA